MSLFRVVDWISHVIPHASAIQTAAFIEDREQLIVGGEDGQLSFIDAGAKKKEKDQLNSILLTYRTEFPILQIEVGEFLSTMNNLIAVLSPSKLVYYRLNYDKSDESKISIDQIFVHSLSISAWNMCKITAHQGKVELLVQTIDCKLSLYDGDQCIFVHCPLRSLHPGPILYCNQSSSFLVANNGFFSSVKYSLLSSGSQKRINYDWSFNLGDTALQMELHEASQTSIVVLCRRHVTCLTTAGNMKWQIRLESVGTSMCLYRNMLANYQSIRLIVATSDDNLLIFNEDKLAWNCNAAMTAVAIKVCSYSKIYENVITMLSAEGKLVLGYLGTEPNLYKVPTDTKIVNFAEKMEQLKQLEQKIRESDTSSGSVAKKSEMQMRLSIGEKGKRTIEHNAQNNVPYCTVMVEFSQFSSVRTFHINVISDLATPSKQVVLNISSSESHASIGIPFYVGADKMPISSKVTLVAHCFHSQLTCIESINLPIDILFYECAIDRNAKYRVTLDTDAAVIPVNKLFPEMAAENPQSIGFQVHGYDATVSVFAANKSNRYRVQSEHLSLLQYACAELTSRVKAEIKNINIGSLVPFEYISEIIDSIKEEEKKKKDDEKRIDCRMKEVRAIEALSLNMSKSGNMQSLSHLDALFEKSYRELLDSMDQYSEKNKNIANHRTTLASLFQLASDLSKNNKVDTILNGYFCSNTQQTLLERLQWAVKTEKTTEMKLIEKLCEHSVKELPKIKEEDENEEQTEQ